MQYSKYLRPVLALAFFISMLLVLARSFTAENASVLAQTQDEERKLENLIPKNVPISIKIKKEKEKSFKNLNNEEWANEFELEVTNTGDKPIYNVFLIVTFDVKESNGKDFLANVYWGRTELGDYRVHATPDDPYIKPDESVVLRFHSAYLNALDKMRREEGRPLPAKLQVKLGHLSFGDGTGYNGDSGTLLPRKIPKPPTTTSRSNRVGTDQSSDLGKPRIRQLHSTDLQPAFVPVDFCPESLFAELSLEPESTFTECCPAGCFNAIRSQWDSVLRLSGAGTERSHLLYRSGRRMRFNRKNRDHVYHSRDRTTIPMF